MKVEVKVNQSQEVDWTKNPQLVVSQDGRTIVLVHEKQSDASSMDNFVGTSLDSGSNSYYSNSWVKSGFKPFHGEITLKND